MTGQDDQSTLKMFVYATNKNQILVRLTNMEDNFDINDAQKQMARTYTVDMRQLAQTLYERSNALEANSANVSNLKFSIEETTLTGVTNYKKRMIQNTEWQTSEPLKQAFNSWHTLQQSMTEDPVDEIKVDANNIPSAYKVHLEA